MRTNGQPSGQLFPKTALPIKAKFYVEPPMEGESIYK